MPTSFFDIPREIRNQIYVYAGLDAASNFEIPWDLADFVCRVKTVEVQKDKVTTIKIPRAVDEARMLRAPAMIVYPLAFTCRQALVDYIEELTFHVGKQPSIAFVANYKFTEWDSETPLVNSTLTAGGLVDAILKGQLPHNTYVRVHCDLRLPKGRHLGLEEWWLPHTAERRDEKMPLAPFKHASELEVKFHGLPHSRSKISTAFFDLCNNHLTGATKPNSITFSWSMLPTETLGQLEHDGAKLWSLGKRMVEFN